MISKDRQIKNFNKIKNTPTAWQYYAENLLLSSKYLWGVFSRGVLKKIEKGENPSAKSSRIFGVAQMLRGMALECLFKAIWLKGGGKLAIDGKYKGIPYTNDHNLISLYEEVSKKIDLNITDDEKHLLKRLSLVITVGRYPIPKKWDYNKKGYPKGWSIKKDEKLLDSLVNRIIKYIEE